MKVLVPACIHFVISIRSHTVTIFKLTGEITVKISKLTMGRIEIISAQCKSLESHVNAVLFPQFNKDCRICQLPLVVVLNKNNLSKPILNGILSFAPAFNKAINSLKSSSRHALTFSHWVDLNSRIIIKCFK